MSSEGSVGSERRGELLKRWAESVVRQLNTTKVLGKDNMDSEQTYLGLESARGRH
jgi:hypothetical protein